MTALFIVNVSSINDFAQCRWRWVAKWLLNRVPRGTERPLTFGKLLHCVFEEHLETGRPMADCVKTWCDQYRTQAALALHESDRVGALMAVDDLMSYAEPLSLWRDLYPIEAALEVEKPFEIEHPLDPSIRLRGRPDRIAPLWGRLFHIQNRSLAAGTNFGLYCQLAERHMHEHVYAYATRLKYPGWEYGGTIMNLLRKLKYRGVSTKACPEGKILHPVNEIVWQGMVTIAPARTEEMMKWVFDWCNEMRMTERLFREDDIWPPPNERMNGGFYGNKIDPYFRVLQGEVTLMDNTYFKDREDTYAQEEDGQAASNA